jgi:tetratricopeptide (TPR) repeat protein
VNSHVDKLLYASLANRASDLIVAGDRLKAIEILEELVRSDLPDFDRAMMCMNIAIVQDQMRNTDGALETYTRAVDLERATESYFVAQSRAAYFSQLGMYDESIRSYDDLLRHDHLKPEDREMFLKNIGTLGHLGKTS